MARTADLIDPSRCDVVRCRALCICHTEILRAESNVLRPLGSSVLVGNGTKVTSHADQCIFPRWVPDQISTGRGDVPLLAIDFFLELT